MKGAVGVSNTEDCRAASEISTIAKHRSKMRFAQF